MASPPAADSVAARRLPPPTALASFSTSALHALAGECLVRSTKLSNWGGTTHVTPQRLFEPRSVEQCLALVELARRERKELRAVGRAHSPSDLMWSQEWMVRMQRMEGVVQIDAAKPSITVLAGTYVSAIHDILAAATPPLAMSNVGSISEQTLGGLIATATHGTGYNFPVVSAAILSLRIIVALPAEQGGTQVLFCSRQVHPDLFNATLCGLGCTGLIVEAELAVEPAFNLRQVGEEMTVDFLFGPSTGYPAVLAPPETPRFSPRSKAAASGAEASLAPQRQSIGALLARGERLPPAKDAYLPSVRTAAPAHVYPLPADVVREEVRQDEEDDEVTREAQRRLERIVQSSQHAKIMYWPQARMCTVFRADRTFEPQMHVGLGSKIYGRVVGHDLTQLLLFVSRYHRALPPRIARLVYWMTHPSSKKATSLPPVEGGKGSSVPPPPAAADHTPGVGRTTEEGVAAGPSSSASSSRLPNAAPSSAPASSGHAKKALVARTTELSAAPSSSRSVAQAGEHGARVFALRAAAKRGAVSRPSAPAHRVSLDAFLTPPPDSGAKFGVLSRALPAIGDGATYHSINTSHKVFNMDCLFPQHTSEWAIPLAHAAAALRALREWLEAEEAAKHGERIHFPVEIRFADADGIWLSHAQGRKTCFIGVIQFRPYNQAVRYRVLFARFEALMRHFAGRPHWAKTHTVGAAELARLYPHLPDFLACRAAVDPDGVFLNPYVRRHVLGEVGEAVGMRVFKSRL